MGHNSRSVDSILQGANDRLGQGTGLGGRFYMITRLRKMIVWTRLGEESKEPQGKVVSSVDTKSVHLLSTCDLQGTLHGVGMSSEQKAPALLESAFQSRKR